MDPFECARSMLVLQCASGIHGSSWGFARSDPGRGLPTLDTWWDTVKEAGVGGPAKSTVPNDQHAGGGYARRTHAGGDAACPEGRTASATQAHIRRLVLASRIRRTRLMTWPPRSLAPTSRPKPVSGTRSRLATTLQAPNRIHPWRMSQRPALSGACRLMGSVRRPRGSARFSSRQP